MIGYIFKPIILAPRLVIDVLKAPFFFGAMALRKVAPFFKSVKEKVSFKSTDDDLGDTNKDIEKYLKELK